MKRPQQISAEQKLSESAFIRGMIKDSGYTQSDIAGFLGTKQTAISPWLSKKTPNAIPDWAYLRLADVLGFDPSRTRPWLWDMYIVSERVFKKNKLQSEGASDLLADIASSMTPEELLKSAGALEMIAKTGWKTKPDSST